MYRGSASLNYALQINECLFALGFNTDFVYEILFYIEPENGNGNEN